MAVDDTYGKGPTHGYSARGYSAAYDKDRDRAEKELNATMKPPSSGAPPDLSVKNPDHEFETPASMPPGSSAIGSRFDGPSGPGNSRGDGSIDPQGQQGGTEGGQPNR